MAIGLEIVIVAGRLDSLTSPEAEQRILATIDSGATKLLLDFSELTYISSAGLRVVLVAAKRMRAVGGKLAVCSANLSVNRIFEVSGFTSFLDIQPTLSAAEAQLANP
jgi:anti-anti-sigma factor